jgi:hypothetical protein
MSEWRTDARTRNKESTMPSPRLRTKAIVAAGAAVLAVACAVAPAFAVDPQFDSSPDIGSFSAVTLNGTQQLSTATIAPFIIEDTSGTLNGWNVTMTVPDLENGTGADCATGATATLAAANLAMNAPVVTAADGGTSMTGVTSAGYTDFTSPRVIIDAAAGNGEGRYDVSPDLLQLTVPVDTVPGTYCTLATIAIASGP